jgi:hypothetical protein
MNKLGLLLLALSISSININAQTSIEVADFTLKVSALDKEIFYYGFAAGDQLIFNFQEVDGKELKEIEITELPSSTKFMDYKTKMINDKIINVSRTGIYKFRFYNSALAKRICKVKIHRIPVSEKTKKFNSTVYWRDVYDTSYNKYQENYIERTDTVISNLDERVVKVHSILNPEGNKTSFNFSLPLNTIYWSYYIGVDQAGQEAYESAAKKLSEASPIVSKIPGYGPLAALALGSASYISKLSSGEDIDFYLVDGKNENLFLSNNRFDALQKGKVINASGRMTSPLTGTYYFCFYNDNSARGVSVTVNITAIVVNNKIGQRENSRIQITTHQEPYLEINEVVPNQDKTYTKNDYVQLVSDEFDKNNYDKCILYAKEAINQNVFPARMYFKLGACYLAKKQIKMAEENYLNGVKFLQDRNVSKEKVSPIINKGLSDIEYLERINGKLNGSEEIKQNLNSFVSRLK